MNWAHTVWFGYTYPSLKGNGPEALVQTVVYGLIAVAVYPPLRHWFRGEFTKVHSRLNEAHAKMDHIIKHHPDIPEFKPKETK